MKSPDNKQDNSKKGRTASSQKSTVNSDFAGLSSGYNSLLRIDPKLQAELDSKNLACRWISAKDFAANGNFHMNDWRPYKFESLKVAAGEGLWGSNPEGYLIRKEMVLAVKPKELQDQHKARLAQRTAIQSQANKSGAQQLRKALGGSGAKVYEGYEANGGSEGDDE